MSQTVAWNGHIYTKHEHTADWKVLHDTYAYDKPYFSSDKNKKVEAGDKLYTSKWKTEVKDSGSTERAWYYFSSLGGWIPWTAEGKQIIKRVGDVKFCEEASKSTSDTDDNKKKNDTKNKIPKISKYFDGDSEDYKHFIRSQMIYKDDKRQWNYKFNRMQFPNPYNSVGNCREYLFFTKPDLHIRKPGLHSLNPEIGNDPFWLEVDAKYVRIIRQLQMSVSEDTMPFMPILSNSVASSLDLPAISGETNDTPQTIYGTAIQYRQGSFKSDENFDFSLEFYDNPWLEVYHLFKMWDEYEKLKTIGVVSPPKYGTVKGAPSLNRYIVDKILHDQIGIYKFIVEDDMETIMHYSYMCGCFPKSVPRDTFKDVEAGMLKYSIDWHAQFVEDMNPTILADFNSLCRRYVNIKKDKLIPVWSEKYREINGGWRACPYVVMVQDTSRPTGYRFRLKWFDK
jgi:hypothetical protein